MPVPHSSVTAYTYELTGESRDPNGIESVHLSYDNGHTFNRMSGTDSWSYQLDTGLLADGTQPILIKAVDKTGTTGLYNTTINIDSVDSGGDPLTFMQRLREESNWANSIRGGTLVEASPRFSGRTRR